MKSMSKKSKIAAGAVALGLALTFAAAVPANAINRAPCGPDYLQLFSSNTTCWANQGETPVTLYGVTGLSSGNNAGWISGPSISASFGKYASTGWAGSYTVTRIHIN